MRCLARVLLGALLSLTVSATSHSPITDLMKDLQAIADGRAKVWNCTFSVSVKAPRIRVAPLSVASGQTADVDHHTRFAWGSITKMWTGASIMQLVAKSELKLDEPMAPLVDAQLSAMKKAGFPNMNFSSLADLYGMNVSKVTLRHLLAMRSGIPDYDTAVPKPGKDLDPFRATVYAHASKDYNVPLLMSLPWVAFQQLDFPPGRNMSYSSTNFELLGLILARHAGIADYRKFNQSSFLPSSLAAIGAAFAPSGSPRENGVMPGYDRTDYNGQEPNKTGIPVVDVHGVFAGWSCADFIGPPSAVAEIGYALWGKPSTLVPEKYRDMMIPTAYEFYGLASMNVGFLGLTGDNNTATGHLGATYGYDSLFGYVHDLDVAIAVATDIETLDQIQAADAYCLIYNRIKHFLTGGPVRSCAYKTNGYYGGQCICKPTRETIVV